MALRKIARMGHPVLRTLAQKIELQGIDFEELAQDMAETMVDANGIGLAGPQIYECRRIIVVQTGLDDEGGEPGKRGDGARRILALLNPEWEPASDEIEEGWEGCLSIPGIRGQVPRNAHIRFHGFTLDGKEIEAEAKGLQARVIQHEVDHLDGILFPDRMKDLASLMFETEWQAYRAAAAAAQKEAASEGGA